MNKLTDWYPANILPVRTGVYEVDPHDPAFAYWDGYAFKYRCWSCYDIEGEPSTIERAFLRRNSTDWARAQCSWRGLTHES